MKNRDTVGELLNQYLFWGIAASASFIACASILLIFIMADATNYLPLFIILLLGFAWIGATAMCRHSLVTLKKYIGRRVHLPEFLSTQFVFFLFPYSYGKLKREVDLYRVRAAGNNVE